MLPGCDGRKVRVDTHLELGRDLDLYLLGFMVVHKGIIRDRAGRRNSVRTTYIGNVSLV